MRSWSATIALKWSLFVPFQFSRSSAIMNAMVLLTFVQLAIHICTLEQQVKSFLSEISITTLNSVMSTRMITKTDHAN